ncbi:hypothetical protein M0R45_009150 [Rubus argutus]|uniref:Uncharacterized protein n=1 Tax=Rubus argutus TaxID=59490 RepID=A0AAW1Y681_RUBAR
MQRAKELSCGGVWLIAGNGLLEMVDLVQSTTVLCQLSPLRVALSHFVMVDHHDDEPANFLIFLLECKKHLEEVQIDDDASSRERDRAWEIDGRERREWVADRNDGGRIDDGLIDAEIGSTAGRCGQSTGSCGVGGCGLEVASGGRFRRGERVGSWALGRCRREGTALIRGEESWALARLGSWEHGWAANGDCDFGLAVGEAVRWCLALEWVGF